MKKYKNVQLPEDKHQKLKVKAVKAKKSMANLIIEKCEL